MQPYPDLPTQAERPLKGTGSLLKALRLLSSMADAEGAGMRLNEVVSRTNLDPATAHRMLACFVAEGFLEKLPGKRYRLGPRVYELGLAATPLHTAFARAHRHLHAMARDLGVTAVLTRRSGAESVYVDRVEVREAVPGRRNALGTRLPLGIGAGGIAILASMPAARVDELIDANATIYRRYHHAAPRLLRERVLAARSTGFAVTDCFVRPETRAVGVLVPPGQSGPEFAVSVVFDGPHPCDLDEVLPMLSHVARSVSHAINPQARSGTARTTRSGSRTRTQDFTALNTGAASAQALLHSRLQSTTEAPID